MWIYITIGIVVLLLLWLIVTYNRLVVLKNRVRNNWSQVDIVLKNRYELIPALVETVKGYAAHEKETITQVIEARTRYATSRTIPEKAFANEEVSGQLSRLMMVAENYPDLKANDHYLQLTQQLTSVEDKIRFARQFYNDTVEAFNTAVMSFPTLLIAGIFGFREEPFFQIDTAERSAQRIQL